MTTITRKINSSTNVIDKIYINNKLQFEQSNIASKNRFGAKQFRCNNGQIIKIESWNWE